MTPDVLKDALRQNDIKSFITKCDRSLQKVHLNKVRSRVMNRYINSMIVDILAKEVHQSRRSATNI